MKKIFTLWILMMLLPVTALAQTTANDINYYYCPLNLTRLSQHAENGVLGDFLVATSPYC